MRVVSLVPSWTELLIECGVNVVGRTRFCIHPSDPIKSIPVVGGTKDLDLEKLKALGADLLLLDQEENLAWMKEQSPIPVHVSHVTSVESVSAEIRKISHCLNHSNPELLKVAERWEAVNSRELQWSWQNIPGELEVLSRKHESYEKLVYVIWKNPWMAVSKETFIGSVLIKLGARPYMFDFEQKYPSFELEKLNLEKTYFLFSSEPFPFHKKKADLLKLGIEGSLVDGESFSWFGLRSLKFLEELIY